MIALRVVLLAVAGALPVSAVAQQMDHSMPMPGMEAAPKKEVAPRTPASPSGQTGRQATGAAPAAGTPSRPAGAKRKQTSSAASPAGHNMGAMGETGPMGGMGGAKPEPPNPPPPPAALSGPAHAADLVFAPSDMAQAREALRIESGDVKAYRVLLDQFETQFQKGAPGYRWDVQAWYGGDLNKLWIKTEGSGAYRGRLEDAEVQVLWNRTITPWTDLQMGVRQDFGPIAGRTHAVLGLQSLRPFMYNVEAALFLSNRGEVTARFEAEYRSVPNSEADPSTPGGSESVRTEHPGTWHWRWLVHHRSWASTAVSVHT